MINLSKEAAENHAAKWRISSAEDM